MGPVPAGISWRTPLPRRLWLALAASVLAHGLIAEGLLAPAASGRRLGEVPVLSATLQARPPGTGVRPEAAPAVLRDGDDGLPAAARPAPAAAPASPVSAVAARGGPAMLPDNRLYSAAELDRYPVPLQPLDVRVAALPPAVRLWVSIDSAGRVTGVAAADPGLAPAQEQQLRDWLAGMRFTPAFLHERPVGSRILVELRP